MNNQTNKKRDNVAAIGIGAMIVFIALILVAAVAAAVIIQTAEKLQQNAQSAGDDTQEQMSTKVVLISTVISSIDVGPPANYTLLTTFELAPGSNPLPPSEIAYTIVCDDANGGVGTGVAYAQGNWAHGTIHSESGRAYAAGDTAAPVDAGTVLDAYEPGTTYIVEFSVTNCQPDALEDHTLIISVTGGGSTYEQLQYGSSPAVGDVVV